MERHANQSPVTDKRAGTIVIQRALQEDEPAVTHLLEQQAMKGNVHIAMGRQPRLRYAMDVDGDRHTLMVGKHQPSGRLVGCGCRSVCQRWVNGQPKRVGYLGLLRRDPSLVGHIRLLRDGWRICDEYRQNDEEPYDLTSIISDNLPARRLLERGIRNLPTYQWHADLQSLVFGTRQLSGKQSCGNLLIRHGNASLMPLIVDFLNQQHSQYQFAPCWTVQSLQSETRARDLQPEDFLLAFDRDTPVGIMAVWDQRRYKQAIVKGYASHLARWRWAINTAARLTRQPALPKPGSSLNMAFISHWAIQGHDPMVLKYLLKHATLSAMNKGIELLLMTVSCDHPCHPQLVEMVKVFSYPSRLYVTHRGQVPALDQCPTYVEAALL